MGLFNLKKSKNNDDDFEASDEWLMGLAGDIHFEGSISGPNASIPEGLASLAPDDDDDAAGLLGYGSTSDDLLDSENVDLSSWHFPDLAADESATAPTDMPANPNVAPDFASPFAPSPSAESPRAVSPRAVSPHAVSPREVAHDQTAGFEPGGFEPPTPGDAVSYGEPPVTAPATLFHESHTSRASFEPFADDAIEYEGDLEADPDHRSNGFLSEAPTSEGMGFGSELFASALDRNDTDLHDTDLHDIEDADIIDTGFDETTGAMPLAASFAPRGREADLLCEILGVEPGSAWSDLRAAHAAAMSEYDPRLESDEDRIALAWAIRREMNATYATLRLLAAA